jgi:hypothetical protein
LIIETHPDIKSAWEAAYFGMLDDRPGVIDFYQRNIIHSFGNFLRADSAVFDFDLGDIDLTITKWSKFTGQYVDVEQLHAWVNNAPNVKTYDALWSFKIVPPNFTGKKAVHQWGNCLMGYSFRRKPEPVLSLYTRAQSLGFSGVADYALSDFVARKLAERLGIPQENIRLEIHCANFIIKMVEVVAVLRRREIMGQPHNLADYMKRKDRVAESIQYYIDYMDRDPDDIPWRAARRWKQKLMRVEDGVHRSLPVENLTIKGWEAHKRVNRKLTSRQVSDLVLTGKGKQGLLQDEELETEEDAILLGLQTG